MHRSHHAIALALLAATGLSAQAAAGPLPPVSDPITLWASLDAAEASGSDTVIQLNNDSTYVPLYPNFYQSQITGSGYTVNFNNLGSDDGVLQGPYSSGAVPVAGVLNGQPTYLKGDFGSPTTTSSAASGAYFTTGLATGSSNIEINFSTTIDYITLLWGSVDTSNLVTLLRGGNDVGTVTGTQVQTATKGFAGNGYQGAGGSAYVEIYDPNGFNSIEFSSGVNSFEFAGIAGSMNYFQIPEPAALSLFATAVMGLAGARGLRKKQGT